MNIKNYILRWVNKHFQFIKYPIKKNLLIIDDTFPDVHAGYKIAEFHYYNENIKNTHIITDMFTVKYFGVIETFNSLNIKYKQNYPNSIINIKELKLFTNINYKLAYCLFYNNIVRYYKFFENHKVPFGYTLYPGGGFTLESEILKNKLLEIHNSKYFRFVIVNQKVTKKFLIENKLCDETKIIYLPGSPIELNQSDKNEKKLFYSSNKSNFDIAFIAHKYIPGGLDKGFDVFCEVCDYLEKKYNFFNFHVIGNFSTNDVPNNLRIKTLKFHGLKPQKLIIDLLKKVDLIISPNRANLLGKGFFDGFPLGSSSLGGINGVPLMLTDMLNENTFLDHEEDFILINTDSKKIINRIEKILEKPEDLEKIGENSRNKFIDFFSESKQLKPRLQLLEKHLDL